MSEWASPWATASASSHTTPNLEVENPFAFSTASLAPPELAPSKESKHKASESVWSTFTHDASVWSDGAEDGHGVLGDGGWADRGGDREELSFAVPSVRLDESELDKSADLAGSTKEEEGNSAVEEQEEDTQSQQRREEQAQGNETVTIPQSLDSDIERDQHPADLLATIDEPLKARDTRAFQSDSDFDDSVTREIAPLENTISEPELLHEESQQKEHLYTTTTKATKSESISEPEHQSTDRKVLDEAAPPFQTEDVEDPLGFAVSQDLYTSLFPSKTEKEASEVHDDSSAEGEIISSVTERKAWYRISRQGTMLEFNSSHGSYIRITWRNSAIQKKALGIIESWIQEDRSNVGSNLFSASMKSGATFNWSDKPEPTEEGRPSFDRFRSHTRQKPTQSSIATSSSETARSSTNSERAQGLGFSWSSQGRIAALDPPTPPSSAGLSKSHSREAKAPPVEDQNKNVVHLSNGGVDSPTNDAQDEDEEDFGDFEQFTPQEDTRKMFFQDPQDTLPDATSPIVDPPPSSFVSPGAPHSNGIYSAHIPQSSWHDVLQPMKSPPLVLESAQSSDKTVKFASPILASPPSPPLPINAPPITSTIQTAEYFDPWSGLDGFDQPPTNTKSTPATLPSTTTTLSPETRTKSSSKSLEDDGPSALDIIRNLPDLSFMLR